jgi:hypothetical protein
MHACLIPPHRLTAAAVLAVHELANRKIGIEPHRLTAAVLLAVHELANRKVGIEPAKARCGVAPCIAT